MKLLFLFSSADNVGDVFDNGMSFQNKVLVQREMIINTSDTPLILSLMSFDYIVREMEGTFCDSSPVISELFYSQSASLIILGLFPFRWFVPGTALPLKTDGGSREDNIVVCVSTETFNRSSWTVFSSSSHQREASLHRLLLSGSGFTSCSSLLSTPEKSGQLKVWLLSVKLLIPRFHHFTLWVQC